MLIPIMIGLSVVAYFVVQELDQDPFEGVVWSWSATTWMVVALLMVACRDVGYMYRLRVLTDKAISWRRAFDVIMLWEFASAITPSIVGGSGVAIFIVHREGLSVGRSTAVVMVTAFLDELFYVVMVPIVLLMVGMDAAFPANLQQDFLGLGVKGVFLAGYLFIVLLILLIVFGIFIHPKGSRALLINLFRLPLLRRWKAAAARTGDELIITSAEMRGKNARFWFKVTAATFLSWTARFWIVNFLILAFTAVPLGIAENFLIYARQLSMWVILLI
ncbi:MAG: lysylphosphatidylglycerol synthase domain-containing protein, partial [Bacteroidota bacterium]